MNKPLLVGSILLHDDERVAQFVLPRIRQPIVDLGAYVGLGVVRGGKLVAGVIYHNWRPVDGDVQVIIAADDARWCLPKTMRALFAYAFETLDCVRMTAVIAKNNKRCRRLTAGLGFKYEGYARRAIGRKHDALIYGILREECRFLTSNAAPRKVAA